ncbi:hypothetical protein [Novosphingobium guangzhouense]|uniref:J domain-containing protein n=1 Tax=Novosphingobium guangzhouense TaxID=1850347 RepID=A0A2K2G4F8_9SPHN|nr:hypothetical protein [Novosphingobium guangzhouense]PNU05930.1 hypothetical protein A8V01_14095 [Novosphingobium guangzhouense]
MPTRAVFWPSGSTNSTASARFERDPVTAAFPWSLLGIEPTGDARAIRGAYAAQIKTMDLDADVEGYARLRQARDEALRMAKAGNLPVSPAPEPQAPGEDAPTPAAWPHAAPLLDGTWSIDPALTVPDPAADAATDFTSLCADFAPAGAEPQGTMLLACAGPSLVPPLVEGYEAAPTLDGAPRQSPFAALAAALAPELAATPLDDGEEAQALVALDAVLDAVHWSPLAQQAEMEDWLANLLAQGWPRSAPLLEKATEAFGWEQEWGRLDARAAVDYLGARLRGYRFQRKVQEPGHRYHKAWKELHRPGRAGPFRFLRVSGADVRGLLAGVRKTFPELEDHFDPQRVASWEEAKTWPTGLIVLGGMILLAFLLTIGDDPKSPQARQDAFEATVTEVFGEEHDPVWLSGHQPDLATLLANAVRITGEGAVDRQTTIDTGIELVRARTYLDGRMLDGEDFETTMRLRLALLQAARADSLDACHVMMKRGSPPATTAVPLQVREDERRFAAALVQRGMLKAPAKAAARSARVPPELVRKVMADTGLSKDQVSAAMTGENDPNRCAATIALLKATLDWQGEGRHDILMTL